ncbi:MAG: bifunctional diaminohydroxyphosphoribosylaminopyrimidine deaminase/5-amino-6-(5-phosphoribosylamino)uracil reductase RibD [Pseudomonadota bacterium]|nr:bifunctional diaminohydroxyphosphoribosylaminopyrimidine deaminase/5-amino-6-(5-phosphoribosylamino)uracil reductase RibD [Pseudomonadota bacterium]
MAIISDLDTKFSLLAIRHAQRGVGQTGPNPSVGCILVKNNRIVGRGVTARGGRPHAESQAIQQAGSDCQGATMYVSLEPCCHQGETPPCTDTIVKSGIVRVVSPLTDPDRRVSGQGFQKLREGGVKVTLIDKLQREASKLIEGFISRITRNRPFITLKLAISMDGKIATKVGQSKWITNERSRAQVQLLRLKNDAVLVGTATLRQDKPSLELKTALKKFSPPRKIFLDRQFKNQHHKQTFLSETNSLPIFVIGKTKVKRETKIFKTSYAQFLEVGVNDEKLNLSELFKKLGQYEINSVLVEGGGILATSLLVENLVDRLILYNAGIIIGANGKPSFGEISKIFSSLDLLPSFKLDCVNKFENDIETVWIPSPIK